VKNSVLIVGGDGLIGSHLADALMESGQSVVVTTRRTYSLSSNNVFLDLENIANLERMPECETVVLCAAVTSNERCRKEPKLSRSVNVRAAAMIANFFVKRGCHVVFISTNLVFDGSVPFAGNNNQTCPLTEYGRQKAEAEAVLKKMHGPFTIIRLSKVISTQTLLFCSWMRDLYLSRRIYPFSNYRFSPIPISFVITLLLQVIELRFTGVVQASASSDLTYAGAAAYLAKKFDYDASLIFPTNNEGGVLEHLPMHTTLAPVGLKELGLDSPDPALALEEFACSFDPARLYV
jgi:dTDP-4-dehydrorhamnose reductase